MGKLNRKNFMLTCLLTFLAFQSKSQDSIEGIWLTEEGNMKIQIYGEGKYHHGKLVWLAEPKDEKGEPLTDVKNPEEALRTRPLIGINMLQNLKYKDGQWKGKLYAPKRGIILDVEITFGNKDELNVQVSYRMFSKEQIWSRVTM